MIGSQRWKVSLLLIAAAFGAAADAAFAQASADNRIWTVEFYLGGAGSGGSGGTAIAGFPIGPTLVTTQTGPTSRAVSSWFFGDGATILNAVNAAHNDVQRVAALDATLRSAAARRSGGPGFGFRLTRVLRPRWSLQLDLNVASTPVDFTPEARVAIARAATSFEEAWDALMSKTPSAAQVSFSSTATFEDGTGGEIATTAAVRYQILSRERVAVFATAGAGTVFGYGGLPAAALTANYRFMFANQFPIDDTDRTTIRATRRSGAPFAGIVGAGVDYALGSRQGVRLDARVTLTTNPVSIVVDTNPTVAIGSPAFAISTFTTPSLQWSNNAAATGRSATLSGAPLEGLETFAGGGTSAHLSMTVGYFWRF